MSIKDTSLSIMDVSFFIQHFHIPIFTHNNQHRHSQPRCPQPIQPTPPTRKGKQRRTALSRATLRRLHPGNHRKATRKHRRISRPPLVPMELLSNLRKTSSSWASLTNLPWANTVRRGRERGRWGLAAIRMHQTSNMRLTRFRGSEG